MRMIVSNIGRKVIEFVSSFGRTAIMLFDSFVSIKIAHLLIKEIVEQFINIGRRSALLVVFTSVLFGLAISVQIGMQKTSITPNWILDG